MSLPQFVLDTHTKVAKVDAGALDALVNLDEPNLSNNQIVTFEDGSYQKMAALQTPRLNDNRLTQLTSAMVVGLGATLEGLYLSANAVASVDEDLGTQLGALATLDLNSNKLTAIPDGALPDMGELHRLDLSHNRIAAVTMATIAAGPQTKLTCLELHHTPVAKVDTDAFAMLGGSAGHMNVLGNWPDFSDDFMILFSAEPRKKNQEKLVI